MASAEFMLDLSLLPEVRALIDASVALVSVRNAGVDVYEARHEVDAIERALNALGIQVPEPYYDRGSP